ncbi:hypothetical protein KR52_09355 [Synechococcus sp. KORDI-52]|nr:hypothetical protein KR52_09355 [Synechococcus sp. KORDI-52]
MRKLLFLLLLFPIFSVRAAEPEILCPGQNTVEMRWCASKGLEESRRALKEQLPQEILEKWEQVTKDVCSVAHAPYREGTIYPQMVVGCDDRLNRVLLEEFRRLGS